MKRFEVWIDCDSKDENVVRLKVKEALDKAGVGYTLLATSLEVVKKGSQR